MISLLRRAFAPVRSSVVSRKGKMHGHRRTAAHATHFQLPLECLESRTLLSTATPTPDEQFMLELMNRARALPAVEAKRYQIALNEGLAAGTLANSARQPLAFNLNLISAARQHSQWMLTAKSFSHTGANGSTPVSRMSSAGYALPASSTAWAENLGWAGRKLFTPVTADMVSELHGRLFADANVGGRGHRVNMLRDNVKEVGIGVAAGTFNGFHSAMSTADFASGSSVFLTGVAYTDALKKNKFYNIGEGLGGITISATRGDGKVFTTTTWSSGGYTLPLSAGTYTVRASGNLFPPTSSTVTIKDRNVKVDFLPAAIVDKAAPTATLAPSRRASAGRTRTLRITFKDDTLVDASTIGSGDITVVGPNHFSRSARLISLTPSDDSSLITATFKLSVAHAGRYAVKLAPKSLQDIVGHFNKARTLGSFTVRPS
jgi:uncharacterized protein YkwD